MKDKKRKAAKTKIAPTSKDIFDPNSTHRRPFVRLDGTIEWPRGYTKATAAAWRKKNGY